MTKALLLVFVAFMSLTASAYDVDTHRLLSERALAASILADSKRLASIGLKPLNDRAQLFAPLETGEANTLLEIVKDGAKLEDSGGKSINHFFNPRTGSGLLLNVSNYVNTYNVLIQPTVAATINAAVSSVNSESVPSPAWALGQRSGTYLSNAYAYTNAKVHFFRALTTLDNADRAGHVGDLFDALGHVIHHIQDMAQPQHVRNDQHLQDDDFDHTCGGILSLFLSSVCPAYQALRTPSTYERFTSELQRINAGLLPTGGYAAVYDVNDTNTFSQPIRLWSYNGLGLAEFTNRNFFTSGTMDVSPPARGPIYALKAADLCREAVPSCGQFNSDDVVVFYPTIVDDQFRPSAGGGHPYAASDSIFDPDLRKYRINGVRALTVNRFTFIYDHAYLLPRAVGYSAGLINYLFRGEMHITPPDEGIYGIVDHGANGCSTPCGFRKIKLKLKNTTAGNEVMAAGSLWAVAKYHLNTCYRPDLSGEYGAPAFLGDKCRSTDESISVSAPVAVVGVPRADSVPLTFDFGASVIPINASDVSLQVVFKGKLGSEDDAIAVTTENISEPNFYALTNVSDFVFDTAYQKYYPLGYKNYLYPNVVTNIRFAFGSNSAITPATAIATLDRLGGGEHAQFAVLMPLNQSLASAEWEGDYPAPGELNPWDTQQFSQDDDGPNAGQYTRTCPLHAIRGVYRQYGLFFVQQVVNHIASAKDKAVVPAEGHTAMMVSKPTRANPKAAVSPQCAVWPVTGYYDFSAMPKLTPATAVPWQIRF